VGKNKLARWAEIGTFKNVIQPESGIIPGEDHPIKGAWNEKIFCNQYPIVLELGCGKGEYTIGLSSRFPNRNFIGIDIKGARIWRGAKTAHEKLISNVAFLRTRIEFINSFFAEDEVDEIWITFPDPHNGKRNSNKRLTCPWFLNNYRKFVKNRGIIHLKTDNAELHKYTRSVVKMNDLEILRDTFDQNPL
jgi:tRNA (guanine-N7-)-methyltransferase